ncbi:hypothetical protein RQM47_04480 [Rubrivirga sp. S365]|uniref:Polymerase nucleotidyl transferase domain-containing protein n=1 Tax=Rubrivirga litoralis TaxID=3075598 RepID=A0ABU3BM58_9BACT|nr:MULTISPECIES: hypothetical protein [unclassified Rubrivirga]MDT0630378.1 hypothetical protein [Rubrivirga sp. F394]MDT7855889.1 hypothetical protein [Rubrivirga sp. S365]
MPGSDLDLLVVLADVGRRRDATVALRRVLADLPVAKDVVVASADEVDQRRSSPWHIVGLGLREGREVYAREAP